MKTTTIRYIVDEVSKANPQRTLRNVNRRLNKMVEEMGEIAEAYLNSTSSTNGKGKTWEDVKEEAVDCLIVAIDIALTDIYGDVLVSSPYDGILHLVEHVGLNEDDYDEIIRCIGKDLFNYWTNYKGNVRIAYSDIINLVKDAFVLVEYVYSVQTPVDDDTIIAEVDRKLAKWMESRNKVAEIVDYEKNGEVWYFLLTPGTGMVLYK